MTDVELDDFLKVNVKICIPTGNRLKIYHDHILGHKCAAIGINKEEPVLIVDINHAQALIDFANA